MLVTVWCNLRRPNAAITGLDWAIALLLSAPALLDWGTSRLGRAGSNLGRVATGSLLGIALGHAIALYVRDPLSEVFWVQGLALCIGVFSFEIVRLLDLSSVTDFGRT